MRRLLLALAVAVLAAAPASAYQHLSENEGPPSHWLHLPINLLVDNGPTDISGEIADATAVWNNVPIAKDPWGTLTQAPVDFTGANFEVAWGLLTGDGQQEVVFDETGSVLRRLGLAPESVNGFGESHAVADAGNSVIDDMYLIINGIPSRQASFDRRSTEVHELGHTLGLAHSTVGFEFGKDGGLRPVLSPQVPTMHPFSIPGSIDRRTLEADDVASLAELYPEPSFATTTGTIAGTVTMCGSGDPVLGANVRAIGVNSPGTQLTRVTGFDGEEDGAYEIHGVPPGEYELVIEPLAGDQDFVDHLSMFTRIDTGFAQEFFSADEDDCARDDPAARETIQVGASGVKTADFKVEGATLALVIDVTASMGPELGAMQVALDDMISALEDVGVPFPKTAIVTFRDNASVEVVTRDPERLRSVIAGLTTASTPACPEGSNAALLTAGRLLGANGQAVLITDASSLENGPSRETVDRLYQSKGARITTLLSGNCPESTGSRGGARAPDVPGGAAPDEDKPVDELGNESSFRTFSEESLLSGGVFAFRPGVKSGNSDDVAAFARTAANAGVAAVAPTVVALQPEVAPQGTALDVEIDGVGTSFAAGSAVSVAGAGVSAGAVQVLSPTRLLAHLTVAGDAAEGARDVVVTTGAEMARGVQALRIGPPAASPAILSVAPQAVAAGATQDVTISAAQTHFDASSVPSLGDGVAVNQVSVESSSSLVANVTVAPGSAVGFRDVAVTTGSETVGGGALLVTAAPPAIPRLAGATPASAARGTTVDVAVRGSGTGFEDGTSVATVSGSGVRVLSTSVTGPTAATVRMQVAGDAPLGFRDLIVRTAGEGAALLDGFEITPGAVPTPTPTPLPPPPPPPGPPPPVCSDTTAPVATIGKAAAKRLRGRASDTGCGGAVARVEAAIARKAGRKCRFAARSGRLGRARRCARPVWLRAKGTARWSLRLKHGLPRGRYTVRARALDAAGNVQARPAARRLKVR